MKAKTGRPPLRAGEHMRRVSVYLYEEDAAYLEAMPEGGLSAAVRRCIEWHKITYGLDRLGGGFIMLRKDYEPFMARCEREGKNSAEILAALMEGYANMPTRAEILEALERGPQDDGDNPT